MFSKLTFVALIATVIAAPQQHHTAGQFPAGVDPSKCPDFPICDNAILHGQQPSSANSAPSWNQQQPSQSQWNQPQHQAQPQNQWNSQPRAQQQWNQPQAQQWNQPQPQQWNQPQPQQWNQPQPQQQWNQQPQPQAHQSQPQQSWNSGSYQAPSNHLTGNQNSSEDDINGPGGDKYPAGVNPKSCPNYPYCDVPASYDSAPAAPAPEVKTGYSDRQSQYPAGVSPHTCPNFPYCS